MNPILDVAIGIVLVFLVTAVLVSSLTEIYSGLRHVRAKTLERGIAVMLGQHGKEWLYGVSSIIKTSEPPARTGKDDPPDKVRRSPSYIDAVTFATALVDDISTPDSETLLAAVLPKDAGILSTNLDAAFPTKEQRAAVGAHSDAPDDLARYLLDGMFLPDNDAGKITPAAVATVIGSIDDVIAAVEALGADEQRTQAALNTILDKAGDDPAAVVNGIKEYSTHLSTPRLAALVDGITSAVPLSPAAVGTLGALARRADGDVEKFRQRVET